MMFDQPRVLHLVGSFHIGGSESQAVQLVRLLRGSGSYRVFVAAMDGSGPLRAQLEWLAPGDIPEYRLSSFYNLRALWQLRRLVVHLRRHRIDIVHTHDFYSNIFGMAAGLLARIPIRIAARRESGMRHPLKRLVERLFYRAATVVLCNCHEVRRQLMEEGVPGEKIIAIYNGVDIGRFPPRASSSRNQMLASFGLPCRAQARLVTLAANLRLPVKDHPTFLRAARLVRAALPDTIFAIAGEGELSAPTQALARDLGLGDAVFFLGRCDRIPELLSVTDVAVLSSICEGFSNAVLEYMAAACPVVSTDVGGIGEAVVEGHTGYLVRPGDYENMAQRIIGLLSDPAAARKMGANARKIVEQKFSSEAQLQATAELYARLLAAAAKLDRRSEANRAPALRGPGMGD